MKYLLIISLIIISACSNSPQNTEEIPGGTQQEPPILFEIQNSNILTDYLEHDLWKGKTGYISLHNTMVAMTFAFKKNNIDWQNAFHNQFNRFVSEGSLDSVPSRLYKMHYIYYMSQYLNLSQNENVLQPTINYLYEMWNFRVKRYDSKVPWENMLESIKWKLANKNAEPQYLCGITDPDFFAFAIAADIKRYCIDNNLYYPNFIDEILDICYIVCSTEFYYPPDLGIIFQPGVWDDHKDRSKAGGVGLGWDSSHSRRFPLFLRSIIRADDRDLYKIIKYQFIEQFLNDVVVIDDGKILLNNYISGHNGTYQHYEPYGLSRTFDCGLWIFFCDNRIKELYKIRHNNIKGKPIYYNSNDTDYNIPSHMVRDRLSNGLSLMIMEMAIDLY